MLWRPARLRWPVKSSEGVWSRFYAESLVLRAALPPRRGTAAQARVSRGNSLLVPPGTPDSRPPFQRWECGPDQANESRQGGRHQRKPGVVRSGDRGQGARFCRPCRGCGRRAALGPTIETVGDCRVSLRDKEWPAVASRSGEACDFPVFHAWEAPGCEDREPTSDGDHSPAEVRREIPELTSWCSESGGWTAGDRRCRVSFRSSRARSDRGMGSRDPI